MNNRIKCSVAQIKLCKFIAYLASGTIDLYEPGSRVDFTETPIAHLRMQEWEIKLIRDAYTDEYYSKDLADELNRIRATVIEHIKEYELNYPELTERMLVTINGW